MPQIRAIGVAVLRHPLTGSLLVDEIVEPGTGRIFHRLPGGGIKFQERARDTIRRELEEEYGLDVIVGERLGAIESMFIFEGEPGHEIVLVHEAVLVDSSAAEFDRRPSRDAAGIVAVWRADPHRPPPLLPAEVRELLTRSRR